MKIIRLASGLAWPEGPTILEDGRIIFVETYRSHVAAYAPDGTVSRFAFTGGGPNATALGSDGAVYVTQNGGVVGPWRAEEMCPPSIQRIGPNDKVEVLITEVDGVQLQAPNDLAFGPDGCLYFTDPGRYDPETRPDLGYVFRVAPDGSGTVLAELPPVYPNGIVVEADGSVVWVESYTRSVKRWHQNGGVEELCVFKDSLAVPDGLKVAENGDLYVTTETSGGLHVVAPDGSQVQFLKVGVNPTNCIFGDGVLYVTDGGNTGETDSPQYLGVLWAVYIGLDGMTLFRGMIE